MTTLLLALFLVSATVMIAILVRWALIGYPSTRVWWVLRVFSSFVTGAILGILIIVGSNDVNFWWVPFFSGAAFCVLFTFLVPFNLKRLI